MTAVNLYADNIWLSNLINDRELPKTVCELGGLLYRGTRWKKGYCHYTTTQMAEFLHVSLRSITYAIKALRERGYIEVFRISGRRNNCYRLLAASNTETSKNKEKRRGHTSRYEQELVDDQKSKNLRTNMRKELRTIVSEEKMLLRNTSLPERVDRQEGKAEGAGGAIAPLPPSLSLAQSTFGDHEDTISAQLSALRGRGPERTYPEASNPEQETSPAVDPSPAVTETPQVVKTKQEAIPIAAAEPPERRQRGRPPGNVSRTIEYLRPREPSSYKEWRELCLGLWDDRNPVQRPRWLSRAKWRGFTHTRFAEMLLKLSQFLNRSYEHSWVGRDYADKKLLDWVNNEKFPKIETEDPVKIRRKLDNVADYYIHKPLDDEDEDDEDY